MKHTSNNPLPDNLRQKAEELLQKKPVTPGPLLSEAEMLQLIHELEVQQVELEALNEENIKINFELTERLKELNCHNRISEVMSNPALSIDEVFNQIVHLIPGGWQFPDITGAFIRIRDRVYQTNNYEPGIHFLHQDVKTGDQVIGHIEVSIPDDQLPDATRIFLPEESDLLISISERLGNFIDKKSTEDKLIESARKFRTITEQTGDFIGIADQNGIITYASPASASIFLLPPEDMAGRSFIEFITEADTAKGIQAFRQCFEGEGQVNNVEVRLKRSDGSEFFSELNASQFNTETEQGTLVVIRDITERKQTEKEIHELTASLENKVKERTKQLQDVNERLETDIEKRKKTEGELRWNQSLLQMMATSSPLGFLVVDNRTDEILYFNHRFCQIWNIRHIEDQMQRGELKNNDIIPYCLPVLADIPAFAESCKPLQYEGNRVVLEDEIPFTENRIIRRFTTQIRGADDEYYGRFYIFEDISARKQTEEALRESEKRFSLFMDYLPAVVFLKDHQGRTLFINKYMDRAFGASSWMGKTMLEVFPGELGERLMMDDLNSMKLGYQKIEESLTQLDGKLHHYETQKFIIGKMGHEPLLGGISLDITERKNAETEIIKSRDAANRANLAKSEFLSRMSHELRTPMNSILGFAQLLHMGELNPKEKKGVNHILNSGKHLLGLIDEVLDISRIESGKLSLLPEPVELMVIITETIDTIRPLADARKVNLELVNSSGSQTFAMADRKRLKQVLINLLNNAVKYNRPGGSILIKTESIPQDNTGNVFVRVSITDTGFGIDPNDIPKLFVPFERIGSEKTLTEGTGLGLAVVKKIMDAMGGSVGVDSIAGEGSTFWIDLPETDSRMSWNTQQENNVKMTAELVIANNEIAYQNEEKAKRAAELVILKKEYSINTGTIIPEKTVTLLYIEDNIQNAQLVEEIIRNFRPEMQLIASIYGSTAVNQAKEILPDLIMLDLDLPDMDGIEVLARLQAEDITKSIPVVIVSADATQHQIDKLITAGAKDYLTKPLDVNLFLKVVDEWVKRSM
jgi:PAS domain S-box-containing protein